MDIQVASNFERILFDICDQNSIRVLELMNNLKTDKKFQLSTEEIKRLKNNFLAYSVTEEETMQTIKEVFDTHQVVLDPHSAIGFKALKKYNNFTTNFSYFCFETAHPCKFPDAIIKAINKKPEIPSFVGDLANKEERFVVLDKDLNILKDYIKTKAS